MVLSGLTLDEANDADDDAGALVGYVDLAALALLLIELAGELDEVDVGRVSANDDNVDSTMVLLTGGVAEDSMADSEYVDGRTLALLVHDVVVELDSVNAGKLAANVDSVESTMVLLTEGVAVALVVYSEYDDTGTMELLLTNDAVVEPEEVNVGRVSAKEDRVDKTTVLFTTGVADSLGV